MPATSPSDFPPAPFRSRNSAAPVRCGTCIRPSTRRTGCSKQVIELPDGTSYFSIAQMVRRPVAPHPQPQPRFAIGLGCEIRHAAQAGLCHRHGSGEDRRHADRRQLPALRARKLQPARRAADHAHADPRREHAGGYRRSRSAMRERCETSRLRFEKPFAFAWCRSKGSPHTPPSGYPVRCGFSLASLEYGIIRFRG